jgi:hypothetical protein
MAKIQKNIPKQSQVREPTRNEAGKTHQRTGESRTEEIEKTVGSTGSAPTVEFGEDFSENYGQWDTGSAP